MFICCSEGCRKKQSTLSWFGAVVPPAGRDHTQKTQGTVFGLARTRKGFGGWFRRNIRQPNLTVLCTLMQGDPRGARPPSFGLFGSSARANVEEGSNLTFNCGQRESTVIGTKRFSSFWVLEPRRAQKSALPGGEKLLERGQQGWTCWGC